MKFSQVSAEALKRCVYLSFVLGWGYMRTYLPRFSCSNFYHFSKCLSFKTCFSSLDSFVLTPVQIRFIFLVSYLWIYYDFHFPFRFNKFIVVMINSFLSLWSSIVSVLKDGEWLTSKIHGLQFLSSKTSKPKISNII